MVDFNLESWMTDLAPVIGERTLMELYIPGSHNSAMNQDCLTARPFTSLRLATKSGPDAHGILRTKSTLERPALLWPTYFPVLGPLVAPALVANVATDTVVRGWAVTQKLSLLDQLRSGIRYFDLRIAKVQGEFYFTNTLLSYTDIFTLLKPINHFMREHQGEILILHFQQFYDMTGADYNELLEGLRSLFDDKLCERRDVDISCATFETYIKLNKRVILVWKTEPAERLRPRNQFIVYKEEEILNSEWDADRTRQKEDLTAFLLEKQRERPSPDPKLSVIRGVLDISHFGLQDYVKSNLLSYEAGLNKHLRTHLLPELDTSNGFIYMVDNVSHPDDQATKEIIQLHNKSPVTLI